MMPQLPGISVPLGNVWRMVSPSCASRSVHPLISIGEALALTISTNSSCAVLAEPSPLVSAPGGGSARISLMTTFAVLSHSSGRPLPLTSWLVPLAMSHASGEKLPLQSGSHSSGTRLLSQSGLSPKITSQSSGKPELLQSGSHESNVSLLLQSRLGSLAIWQASPTVLLSQSA